MHSLATGRKPVATIHSGVVEGRNGSRIVEIFKGGTR